MALARTWQIRLNLDDVNAAVMLMETDAEMASFARGLVRGLNAGALKDGASEAYASGWEIGNDGRALAEIARLTNRTNGKSGGRPKNQSVNQLVNQSVDPSVHQSVDQLVNPNHKPITNNQELKNEEQEQTTKAAKPPARVARFIPPTESEWMEYCTATWGDWHPTSIQSSWDHYQSVGWMAGKSQIKDWKATARNSHNTAKQYGKLQPKVPFAGPTTKPKWNGFDQVDYNAGTEQLKRGPNGTLTF